MIAQQLFYHKKWIESIQFLNTIVGFEAAYLEILETAEKEYEYESPSKYNKDGYKHLSANAINYPTS